jgi:predicted phage terminase large subunit-like protein
VSKRVLSQYAEILRTDFTAFVHRTFRELNAAEEFLFSWHIEVLAAKLEAVRHGDIKRLIINIPPRQGKSIIGSVAFPAFLLGHKPSAKIISISYNQDLANDLASSCRSLMESPFYEAIFNTRVSEERRAIEDFQTTEGGRRISTSMSGGITGRGAELIIIDDPIKADDAQSDARRAAVNAAFYNTIVSRLNSTRTGAIVIIMQRLHADDLVSYVTQRDPWEVVALPVIAVRHEVYDITSPYGLRHIERREGEALHPVRQPLEKLLALRASMSEYVFSAQYQQDPQPPQGLIVKTDWLKFYGPAELPTGGTIVQSWDTASKDSTVNDFSVCTTWRYHERHFYLLDVYRERVDFPTLVSAVEMLADRHEADVVLIEDRASGTPLIQELRHKGVPVQEAPPSNDSKMTRLLNQTTKFASGFVHLPKSQDTPPWLDAYILELTTFPNAPHDDQVDSTVHALAWDTGLLNSSFENAIAWARAEAARGSAVGTAGQKRFRIRILRAGQFQLQTRTIDVSVGDVIEVAESELGAFTRSMSAEIIPD